MLVLVDFQNDYYSINYGISRVAIWNVTTKWVTLITGNPQISRKRDP